MRALVTGGAGFIGSAIVDLLVEERYDVVVLDNLDLAAHHNRPEYLNPRATYVIDDLRDPAAASRAVAGVDIVCHQAARVGLGVDFADVADYVGDNALGTANLLKALHDRRFDGRIVLAGSMVVYGEGMYRCEEHGAVRPGPRVVADLDAGLFDPPCPRCGQALEPVPVDETAPLDPRNVYAATKLHQEHLCQAYEREHGGSVISLRYHNVYGPRMPADTPYAGVAAIFRSAVAAGRPPRVFEDGLQTRDFVHVHDVARANLAAMTAAPEVRGPFNVASGEPRTVLDMARAVSAASGEDRCLPEVVGGYRLGDVRHVFASPGRARRELGFAASVGFDDGMREFATAPMRG